MLALLAVWQRITLRADARADASTHAPFARRARALVGFVGNVGNVGVHGAYRLHALDRTCVCQAFPTRHLTLASITANG
jgi:hypothetical protein